MLGATILKDINVKVTPDLEGVVVEVASTSKVAVIIVAIAPGVVNVKVNFFLIVVTLVATVLEDININVTPVLEGVVVEVASTHEVAVVIVATAPEVVDVKVAVFPKVVVVIGRLHWYIRLLGQPVVELWYSLLQLYWLL